MLDAGGAPAAPPQEVADLAAAVAELEHAHRPRWVWPDTAEMYPALLDAGVRVDRCHDLSLAEGLLLGYGSRHAEPRGPAAAWARLHGQPVPADPPRRKRDVQAALFESDPNRLPGDVDPLTAAVTVHAEQQRRLAEVEHPQRMRLLVAAESAGALAAVEMSHTGLPWRADVHDALLTELLGPRPAFGAPPRKLTELAERVTAAFGGRPVNPGHPPSVVQAFARHGISVPSTQARVLREVDHPAVAPLLEYKKLSRLHAAHGWSWLEEWVTDGRFRPEYVVGGVVSGRWATSGGAALQIPRMLRSAVRAERGRTLVVADAAQLEPRVLAALSGDRRLAEVAGDTDLYASLAADSFAGDRDRAKIALLSAMYGGRGGEAGSLLAVLRQRFPDAVEHVEAAARTGEQGELVRTRLGRTSPPPSVAGHEPAGPDSPDVDGSSEHHSQRAARSWGRFTRNFAVQANAADWALVLLVILRRRLNEAAPRDTAATAELVFFQHDELIVHCPHELAETVRSEILAARDEATQLVFGTVPVRFPLTISVVDRYDAAK